MENKVKKIHYFKSFLVFANPALRNQEANLSRVQYKNHLRWKANRLLLPPAMIKTKVNPFKIGGNPLTRL